MKTETFNYIWDEIIQSTIQNINNSVSEEERLQYNLVVRKLNKLKSKIYADYNSIRKILKSNYYDASNSDNDPSNRIDNHKIAACLCYSLLHNKVFSFNVSRDMPKRLFTINYEVAYSVSLSFIYAMLIVQYKNVGRDDLADKLMEQGTLYVPDTASSHDDYHTGSIHTLALNDIYGNTFDVLAYANKMFWIEFYNRQLLENTIKPIPLYHE